MRPLALSLTLAASLLAVAALPACDSDDAGPAVDANGLTVCDESAATADLLTARDFFLAVELAPFGGLQVFFDARIVAAPDRLLTFELSARNLDGSYVSPAPVARACGVPVDADGGFVVSINTLEVPGEAIPTGTTAEILDFELTGQIQPDDLVCGSLEGFVPLFDADLAGSAFAAVPEGSQTSPPRSSCAGGGPVVYDPIATCPTLAEGANSFVSATLDRELILDLPDPVGTDPLPVVFLFHGLGGSGANIIETTGFDDLVDGERFILVVPEGANAADGSRVNLTDWAFAQPFFDRDNVDIVFFDDILTCLSEQYPVDAERVYVTGMSGGGLMSTHLAVSRAEVIAAAAPMSGGWNFAWPEAVRTIPMMITWGGPTDVAFDTMFDALAQSLISNLLDGGHVTLACDHGTGHEIPDGITPALWSFLSSFTLSGGETPWSNPLPDVFPDYCTVAQPDATP